MSDDTPKRKLALLQAFRAVAAISVLLFHVQLIADRRVGITFLGDVFTEGRLGVDFFFVLSGFIISFVHADHFGQRSLIPRYLCKRIIRIYPLLIVLTLGKITAMLAFPGLVGEHQLDASLVMRSLLIIPQKPIPILPMAWTLTHELLFYGLFAVGLAVGKNGWKRIQCAWAVLIVAVSFAMERTGHPDDINLAMRFLFHPHNLQFLMGCWLADHFTRGPNDGRSLFAMFVLAIFLAAVKFVFLWDVHGKLPSCLMYGVVFTLIVWAAVNWEQNRGSDISTLWQRLGDASYSIYLINTPIIAALCVIGARFMTPSSWMFQLWLILISLFCVGCGWVCYRVVEWPLTTWLRNNFMPSLAQQKEKAVSGAINPKG